MNRVKLHSLYERVWHWWQALAISLLILTGSEIHFPIRFDVLGFENAVRVHTVLGFLLIGNAVVGLLNSLVTGSIRAYFPDRRRFSGLATRQLRYYAWGIFNGAPHPMSKTHARRFNPLQQVTYLVILNVLLPGQIVTGLLIWAGQRWPALVDDIGGLGILASVHTFFAWCFTAFILMHVYLTTTAGPRWRSGLLSMITGWQEVATPEKKDGATEREPR